jgi:hypothetical protein
MLSYRKFYKVHVNIEISFLNSNFVRAFIRREATLQKKSYYYSNCVFTEKDKKVQFRKKQFDYLIRVKSFKDRINPEIRKIPKKKLSYKIQVKHQLKL